MIFLRLVRLIVAMSILWLAFQFLGLARFIGGKPLCESIDEALIEAVTKRIGK